MRVLLAPATSVAADDLVLQAREQRPWSLPADLERVAIADPGVADIVMLRGQRQALLVGKAPGTTTLLLWHRKQAEPQRVQRPAVHPAGPTGPAAGKHGQRACAHAGTADCGDGTW
ncbi:hypothetical protein G6F35_018048 [Rhizopus arrhizus]|nr:hypothetical protein G6F35_018048 [Rhizopus arrhizus]